MLLKVFAAMILLGAVLPLPADVVLVENGVAQAAVSFAPEYKAIRQYALILQDYVAKSSGATLPVNGEKLKNTIKLQIKPALHSDIEEFSFTFPDEHTVVISGGSENGLKFGIYRFLEKYLGLRRLFPGKLGDHLPEHKTITVPAKTYIDKPAYLSRYLGSGAYTADTREYYDWIRSLGSNNPRIYMGHYLFALLPQAEYGKTHPEFYPEFNGKRIVPQPGQTTFWQPCFTAPGLAEVLAENVIAKLKKGYENENRNVKFSAADPRKKTVSVGVNDAGGYCTCSNCRQVNGNRINYAGIADAAPSYIPLINKVADIVTAEYPDCRIPFLAYAAVAEIPSGTGKLNKRLVPEITYDSMYTADPVLREKFRKVFSDWSKSLEELALGDYVYGEPFILPRTNFKAFAEQVTWAYDHGARHYYGESYPGKEWTEGPKLYLLIKLLWNPAADRHAILKEWYINCVGEKAAPFLQKYYENLEKFWTQDVIKTPWFQEKRVYPPFGNTAYLEAYSAEKLYENEALLKKCAALTETPLQKERANYFYQLFMKRKSVIQAYWQAQAVRKNAAQLDFSDRVYSANFDPHPKHVSHWQRAKRNAKFLRDKVGGTDHSECLLIDAEGSVSGPSLYEIRIPVQNQRSFRITVKCRAESSIGSAAKVSVQSYWRTPDGKMLSNTYRVTEFLPKPYDDHWRTVTVYNTTPTAGDLRLCIGLTVDNAPRGKVRFDDLVIDATAIKLPDEEKYTRILYASDFEPLRSRWASWQSGKNKGIRFARTADGGVNNSAALLVDASGDKERSAGIYLNTIPVTPKARLLVSSQIKLSADCSIDTVGRIAIDYLDCNKRPIKVKGIKYADHPEVRDEKFRKTAFLSEAPANAAFAKISLESRRAAPGKVWFDDVSVKTLK